MALCLDSIFTYTPLKFNMEPENQPPGKGDPFLETIMFRFDVKLWGVYIYIFTIDRGVNHITITYVKLKNEVIHVTNRFTVLYL